MRPEKKREKYRPKLNLMKSTHTSQHTDKQACSTDRHADRRRYNTSGIHQRERHIRDETARSCAQFVRLSRMVWAEYWTNTSANLFCSPTPRDIYNQLAANLPRFLLAPFPLFVFAQAWILIWRWNIYEIFAWVGKKLLCCIISLAGSILLCLFPFACYFRFRSNSMH